MRDQLHALSDLSMRKHTIPGVLPKSPVTNHSLLESIQDCLRSAAIHSQRLVKPEGFWTGESRCCQASLILEYVLLRQALGLAQNIDRDAICQYLLADQKDDGSWALAPEYPGDVSTTTEAYLALKILGVPPGHSAMRKARIFVIGRGGAAKVRIFTRIFFAQQVVPISCLRLSSNS